MSWGVKQLTSSICFLSLMLGLTAQVDSTFIRYYYPTEQTHPYWYSYLSDLTTAANVFEKYGGSLGLQMLATYSTPPPLELLYLQSPIASYSRRGDYLGTSFIPYNEDGLLYGYYSHIIKDGHSGYLALDAYEHRIHRLNRNLQYEESLRLIDGNGDQIEALDIIEDSDSFIVVSRYPAYQVLKFAYNLDCLWQIPKFSHEHMCIKQISDGSFVNLWWHHPNYKVMKMTSSGDVIWTKLLQCDYIQDFIEIDDRYYGLYYYSFSGVSELRVYDFGIDFANEDPGEPILVIPANRLLDQGLSPFDPRPFCVMRSSNNCILLAISTPVGEIFKFDENFNLLWTSNALPNERIGVGDHPMIELENGDILYCATMINIYPNPNRIGLVRIDENGNYVGIEDYTETTPVKPAILAYPNPFTRDVYIELKEADNSTSMMEVYNIKGQLIETKAIRGANATWTPQNLPSGVYILKLQGKARDIACKMITYIK